MRPRAVRGRTLARRTRFSVNGRGANGSQSAAALLSLGLPALRGGVAQEVAARPSKRSCGSGSASGVRGKIAAPPLWPLDTGERERIRSANRRVAFTGYL